ncbi:MAG: hypothetical protein EXR37_00900 [Limnohabitans sp.]|nr:hypothetical protein [Limnohabitans sp.]
MTPRILFFVSALCLLLLGACSTPSPKPDQSDFRSSKPASVLVLPPVNLSPDIRGSLTFLSTVTRPLSEAGYYVFPVAMVDATFKENGLQMANDVHEVPLPRLQSIFGADAVLYITLKTYGSSYVVIDSQTVVSAKARLVDARTGKLLWQGQASASDAEGRDNNNGLAGLLINSVIQQLASNLGNLGHQLSKVASSRLLSPHPSGILHGPRSPEYGKD